MHSSTSSSETGAATAPVTPRRPEAAVVTVRRLGSNADARLPGGPWGRTWLLAILLAALALGGLEAHWRAVGHIPSVVDDRDLWAQWRATLEGGDDHTVALLGGSRIQIGFATDEFHKRYPGYRLAQLAVDGHGPVAALRDLANDRSFRGIVICDVFPDKMVPSTWDDQQSYVTYYHDEWKIGKIVERRLRTAVQDRVNTVNPSVDIRKLAYSVARRRTLAPFYIETMPDRSRRADFARAAAWSAMNLNHAAPGVAEGESEGVSPEEWLRVTRELGGMARAIQARGGRVIFVRYPQTGELGAREEQRFPHRRYWDVFARNVGVPTVNFQEVPSLSGFTCPDGGHLDYRDAPLATDRLCAELERLGILPASQSSVVRRP